jgi:hypothetical protein
MLALMSNCDDRDLLRIVNLKERNIAAAPKRNNEFAMSGQIASCFTTSEGRERQQCKPRANCADRGLGGHFVLLQQKSVEAHQIVLRIARQTNAVSAERQAEARFLFALVAVNFLARCATNMLSSFAITDSGET